MIRKIIIATTITFAMSGCGSQVSQNDKSSISFNDEKFSKQWYYGFTPVNENYYLEHNISADAHNNFTRWDLKSPDIEICVLDNGFDIYHEDLAHLELSVSNVFASSNDDNFHGTNVLGILGAERNNEIGIVGISPYSNFTIKALENQNFLLNLKGLINKGCDVINISRGARVLIENHKDYIAKSLEGKNTIVVISAGNESKKAEKINIDNFIIVGATNPHGDIASFSNYGDNVDIYATGQFIGTTGQDNKYYTKSGTSLSAPIVTGAIALAKGINPSLTPAELKSLLISSATTQKGFRKLDMDGFLRAVERY